MRGEDEELERRLALINRAFATLAFVIENLEIERESIIRELKRRHHKHHFSRPTVGITAVRT